MSSSSSSSSSSYYNEELYSEVKNLLETKNPSDFIFRIKKDCVTIPLLGKYVPKKYLASGAHGSVYLVCEDNNERNCNYVVKIMHPIKMMKEHSILQEMKITTEMGRAKEHLPPVGPKVLATFSCKGEVNYHDDDWMETTLFFIVMEKMDYTLKDYLEIYKLRCEFTREEKSECEKEVIEIQQHILDKLKEMYKNIQQRGYIYTDVHNNNVMLNVDNNLNIKDIKIIDFGILHEIPKEAPKKIGRFIIEDEDDD